MKKVRILTFLLATVLTALALCVSSFAEEIIISNADDLTSLMQNSDKWTGEYKLGGDINMLGHSQKPIGSYDIPFSGSFDGAGFTIKGLNIKSNGTAGLFGVVSGTVKNVSVEGTIVNAFDASSAETKIDGKYPGAGGIAGVVLSGAVLENCINRAEVEGPGNVGGVAGVIYNFSYEAVTATGCENYGTIYSSAGNCGGVFGRIYISSSAYPAVTVKNCVNHAPQTLNVDNRNRLGGIAGYIRTEAGVVIVENCENKANITANNVGEAASNDYPYAGGIVGRVEAVKEPTSAVQILKCANSGNVTSGKYAGGIVTYIQRGEVCTDYATTVSECINTGSVDAPRFVGGIIGYTENKSVADTYSGIYNCANYGKVTGSDYAASICGRQYGFSIKECFAAGSASATISGAIVGVAEGTVYSEADECYYLNTVNKLAVGKGTSLCIELSMEAITAENAKAQTTFKLLDFDNVWTMGEDGPTLKMLTGESTQGNTPNGNEKPASPFTATRTYENQFSDVTEDKWFFDFVKTSYEYNLANGTSANAFSPSSKFTVAQALTAAANIHKVYFSKEIRQTYPGESWYAPYVTYCIDNGIIRYGMFDNYDRNITRGEMATVFANILPENEYAPVKEGSNPDVTEDMDCFNAVAKLFKAGIVGGDAGTGNFRPNDEIVRSEACVIFTRIALADKRAK